MKELLRITLLLVYVWLLLVSCSEKDPAPPISDVYKNGVFISNEGNFGEGDGSLSFYDLKTDEVSNNIFAIKNGSNLGDVVQSMHATEGRLYIVVNNSNKIEVAGLDSLESVATITGLQLPRYMTSRNGMGYVTEWVSFSDPGRVAVINLETGTIQKAIETDFGAEGLIISDGKLFVSNNFTTTVSVIELMTESVAGTIAVGGSPGSFLKDKEGDLWLLCSGGYDQDFNPLNDGQLLQIDPVTAEVVKTIELNRNVAGKMAIGPSGEQLYFITGNQVFKINITDTAIPTNPFITATDAMGLYGIGIDSDGTVYLSDAMGFSENGKVYRYGSDGSFIDWFTVGRGPNGFLFIE